MIYLYFLLSTSLNTIYCLPISTTFTTTISTISSLSTNPTITKYHHVSTTVSIITSCVTVGLVILLLVVIIFCCKEREYSPRVSSKNAIVPKYIS